MKKRTVQITVVIAIIIILALLFVLKRASTAAELSQPVLPATAQTAAPAAASQPEAESVQTAAAAEESLQPEEDSASQAYAEPEPLFVSQIDEEALRSSGQPVMIQFFSTTCVPCMSMMDDLRAFYSENYGSVRVVALNIGEYPEAAMSYPVSVIPTQLFFTSDGENYIPSQRIIASVGNFVQYTYRDTGELAYVVHQGVLTKSQMERIAADAGRSE